jgi:hypothetical protein
MAFAGFAEQACNVVHDQVVLPRQLRPQQHLRPRGGSRPQTASTSILALSWMSPQSLRNARPEE